MQAKQWCMFINIVKASGTDHTSKIAHYKLEKASTNPVAIEYPHRCLSKMMRVYAKGTLTDLEVMFAIAMHSSSNNDCLTRLSNQMEQKISLNG